VAVVIDIPGRGVLQLEYLVLDINGTLTDRGRLLDGVATRLAALRERVEPLLVSADTFGTVGERAVDVRDRRPGACGRHRAVQQPRVPCAEAPGVVERQPGVAAAPTLPPERLDPPFLVGRRCAAKRTAGEAEGFGEVVGEEVGHSLLRVTAYEAEGGRGTTGD
jgi:hypothetical protein